MKAVAVGDQDFKATTKIRNKVAANYEYGNQDLKAATKIRIKKAAMLQRSFDGWKKWKEEEVLRDLFGGEEK